MRKIQQSEGGKRHGPYRLGGNLAVDQLLHLPEILRRFHPQISARIDGSPLGHGDDRLVFTKVVANPPRAIHVAEYLAGALQQDGSAIAARPQVKLIGALHATRSRPVDCLHAGTVTKVGPEGSRYIAPPLVRPATRGPGNENLECLAFVEPGDLRRALGSNAQRQAGGGKHRHGPTHALTAGETGIVHDCVSSIDVGAASSQRSPLLVGYGTGKAYVH